MDSAPNLSSLLAPTSPRSPRHDACPTPVSLIQQDQERTSKGFKVSNLQTQWTPPVTDLATRSCKVREGTYKSQQCPIQMSLHVDPGLLPCPSPTAEASAATIQHKVSPVVMTANSVPEEPNGSAHGVIQSNNFLMFVRTRFWCLDCH